MKDKIPDNPINDIYSEIANFPFLFKELLCRECNWSSTTFHRKKNAPYKAIDKGKSQLSQAERDAVIKVTRAAIDHIVKFASQLN